MSCAVCRDAQDAARGRDGYDFFANRLRVEMSRGARDRGPPPAPPTFRGRGTGFRVLIKGLPISASWQDLKVSLLLNCTVAQCAADRQMCVLSTRLLSILLVYVICSHATDPAACQGVCATVSHVCSFLQQPQATGFHSMSHMIAKVMVSMG